tara:strand:+ start:1382 stop:1585 length:204 start_codon:yes stop_codon:yes gene_type:complete
MWFFIFIVFSGPMKVERVDVIEIHWNKTQCIESTKRAERIGIPTHVSVGCVQVEGIAKAKDSKGLVP